MKLIIEEFEIQINSNNHHIKNHVKEYEIVKIFVDV